MEQNYMQQDKDANCEKRLGWVITLTKKINGSGDDADSSIPSDVPLGRVLELIMKKIDAQQAQISEVRSQMGESNQILVSRIHEMRLVTGELNQMMYAQLEKMNQKLETSMLANQSRHDQAEASHVNESIFQHMRAPLVYISQRPRITSTSGEENFSTVQHIARFIAQCGEASLSPWLRMRLFSSSLTGAAFEWYNIEHRKRFDGVEFQDLFDLADRISRYEDILKEEKERKNSFKGTWYKDPNYELFSTEVRDELEVDVAEVNIRKPYICEALVKPKPTTESNATPASTSAARKRVADTGKNYSFDLSKTDQIFDHLMADKMISLPKLHKIPSASDLKGKEYCKYHNSWNHATNDCTVLRCEFQKAIDEGTLKFPVKTSDTMKVDTNPFPTIASTNMISLVKRENRQVAE
ncbi:uncharacterized protein LOC132272650 [Cornus florida]|uniref:uncharacterized protein LOC132272650 n=1 Tax=Cornus florida TaxID=4283 RepID=UPI00289E3B30|nr:uncharacterized protein LOC132272650 [Cornus florida]